MLQDQTLADGGIAVVVTGHDFEVPRPFDVHPQLHILPAADLPSTLPGVSERLPANTRIVLIGGQLAKFTLGLVQRAAEQRQVKWVARGNPTALKDVMARILLRPQAIEAPVAEAAVADVAAGETKEWTKKGSVSALIHELADLTKGSAEEARRLLPLAQQRGIPTTLGSLAQGISSAKRKAGATGAPKSALSVQARTLGTFDDAIAGLQLTREYIVRIEQENLDLRAKLERATKALSALHEVMHA